MKRTRAKHGNIPATVLVLLAIVLLATRAIAADPDETVIVDRIVAVIDASPIFLSDLERARALGGVSAQPDENGEDLERRMLDQIIDQRLRLRDASRAGREPLPERVVDEQVAVLENRLGGPHPLAAKLAALDLSRDMLERMLEDQVRVLRYIDQRLRPRVFVSDEDVQSYYETRVRVDAEARGEAEPPLIEVRDAIHTLLAEQGLDEEIDRWTADLRQRADILVLLDQRPPLPPVTTRTRVDNR